MSDSSQLYIYLFEDILDAIAKIESYISGVSYNELCQRPMTIDAVIRNFEVIGEAANKIPANIRNKYPHVEWRQTIGFRNVLIHNYFEIDVESVWETIKKNLPVLKRHIESAYEEEKKSEEI
jgi:uncharacterized protein with HEPN domain